MRSRSNSTVRLDYYQRLVYKTILNYQNPVTGLLPTPTSHPSCLNHAWVRDNLYSIMAVWALAMAYRKNDDFDEDRAKTYELEQSCVKMMRGLLVAMLQQKDKVESFKESQSTSDALHAKYSASTMLPVVGDNEWGHLQLDATSLFLLMLAQMTASGLQIIFTLDEVAFIQNLIFYIESAYCIPDYGIWERGDKTNHGLPELNASSIGMAKAALESMNELDLFGGKGGPSSVIHVLPDEIQKCHAVLESILPRESNSKEIDASLLSIISFPAFAVENPKLIQQTREEIIEKLCGRYGCKRFLRDGHKTAIEDPSRLYYEPSELKAFENIECEWPLFFCYLIIDGLFSDNPDMVTEYSERLDGLLVEVDDLLLVPEMYAVPIDLVEAEYRQPHSQKRIYTGSCPFMWSQSLYLVGKLLQEGFLQPSELDPLNRRLSMWKKPDIVVQIVVLAEDEMVQERMAKYDINIQTMNEISPIEVQSAETLGHLYSYLGKNDKLGLSGRVSREVGILSTSKLYSLLDKIFVFTPQSLDRFNFYTVNDVNLLASNFRQSIYMLKSNWRELGRPILTIILYRQFILENDRPPAAILSTFKKIKSGYLSGTRVVYGNLSDFLSTSCITNLSFLANIEKGQPDQLNPSVRAFLERQLSKPFSPLFRIRRQSSGKRKISVRSRKSAITGIIKRTRSIQIDQYDPELQKLRNTYDARMQQECSNVSSSTTPPSTVEECLMTMDDQYNNDETMMMDQSNQLDNRLQNLNKLNKLSDLTINEHLTDEELINMFKETEILEEHADILHYLFYNKSLDWKTGIISNNNQIMTLRDLLKDIYEKACSDKKWALVRHSAGMLGKQGEDLAKSVADLLVRQKQITVGMPPHYEQAITRPLPVKELRQIIDQAHCGDQSTAMLTHELIIYLSMFIRTEPHLFVEMLRLRIGLIIQVMASELARALMCDGIEASEHLLNLSPYEMKTLLHHIISGKEFTIRSARSGRISIINDRMLSRRSIITDDGDGDGIDDIGESNADNIGGGAIGFESDRHGQWLRRRRLDGALNRVPIGFYSRVWNLLEKCEGIAIEGRILINQLTREMTAGELKFALQAEQVLNSIPQPEYRQLIVEALMVLTMLVENSPTINLGNVINVEQLVHRANQLFLSDQLEFGGDAILCCAHNDDNGNEQSSMRYDCSGAAKICQHFYDSAPSGNYGTMIYLIRSTIESFDCFSNHDSFDCKIQ
uniref:Phosphorylase b kinase regulatory subunit n=1 Tax=Dermatophagoides pteronyssinus TaxID=6956 RepID=A0A6P6Y5M9_DERPT|nr:probable phosphorylase b kinase regulatory subunit alpha [Dermatophagoides pteronyssinus]